MKNLSSFPITEKKWYSTTRGWSFSIIWNLLSQDEGQKYEKTIRELWDEIQSIPEWRKKLKEIHSEKLTYKTSINKQPQSFNNTNYAFGLIKKLPEDFLNQLQLTKKLIKELNEYNDKKDNVMTISRKTKEELRKIIWSQEIRWYIKSNVYSNIYKWEKPIRVASVG